MKRWGIVMVGFSACALMTNLDSLKGDAGSDGGVGDGGVGDANDAGSDGDAKLDAVASDAAIGSYLAEITADSPSAWWRLGESNLIMPASDENGNIDPGAYRDSGVTLGAKGALSKDNNTAAQLDGVTGAVLFSGSIYDEEGLSGFTMEIWASPTSATGTNQRLISHLTASNADGWMLFLDGTLVPHFDRIKSGTIVGSVDGSAAIATGKFTHIVVTSDGSELSLYVNGALAAAGATLGSITATSAPNLVLGASSDLSNEYFAGVLDEAAMYVQNLSAARVLAHYQAATQ